MNPNKCNEDTLWRQLIALSHPLSTVQYLKDALIKKLTLPTQKLSESFFSVSIWNVKFTGSKFYIAYACLKSIYVSEGILENTVDRLLHFSSFYNYSSVSKHQVTITAIKLVFMYSISMSYIKRSPSKCIICIKNNFKESNRWLLVKAAWPCVIINMQPKKLQYYQQKSLSYHITSGVKVSILSIKLILTKGLRTNE